MTAADADQTTQDRLADVYMAGSALHHVRGLAAELQVLFEDAQRNAYAEAQVSHSMLAEVSGLTRSRVTQILAELSGTRPSTLHARLHEIAEWPADALKNHSAGFTGQMLYPPYGRVTTRYVPTITRSAREWVEESGRHYGELTDSAQQEQADLGYWRVGKEIRAQKHPLVIAVDGTIERIYQVSGWTKEPGQRKYMALSADVYAKPKDRPSWLPSWWPAAFELGQPLVAPQYSAYTPARVAPDGTIDRASRA